MSSKDSNKIVTSNLKPVAENKDNDNDTIKNGNLKPVTENIDNVTNLKPVTENIDDTIKNENNLDFMRKILRLIELKKEVEENLNLTGKIAGDLKNFATISILVMIIGIIFLVLKYSHVDPPSLEIVYTTITGFIGSLGILKTAYDWFNGGQSSTMAQSNIISTSSISKDDYNNYAEAIGRSKHSFPNNELEYIYHLDLALETIKSRNCYLRSSNTRRFISFAISAFILTVLVLTSIFFGFFISSNDVVQNHKLISFIADDFLIIGGFLGLLDCLCIYLIIYKPEYFKNRFHLTIFIVGLAINGFCRKGFIKQIKMLMNKYKHRESGDIAKKIVLTIKTIINAEKGGDFKVEPEAVNNIRDLLDSFGLDEIPKQFKKIRKNPVDVQYNIKLIRKIMMEYFVSVDENLRISFEEIENAKEGLKKEIRKKLTKEVGEIFESYLEEVEDIEEDVEKIKEDVITIEGDVKYVEEGVKNVEEGVKNVEVVENFEKIKEDVTENFEKIEEDVTENFEKIEEDVTENFEKIEEDVTENFEKIEEDVTVSKEDVKNKEAKEKVEKVERAIEVEENLKNSFEVLENSLVDLVNRLEDLGNRLWDLKDLKNHPNGIKGRLNNYLKDSTKSFTYLNSYFGDFKRLKERLKDLKILEDGEVKKIKESHFNDVYQKKKILKKKISKIVVPFLCSRCIFESDIGLHIHFIPFIRGWYHIPRVTLQDSEKANIERLLNGLHYDRRLQSRVVIDKEHTIIEIKEHSHPW